MAVLTNTMMQGTAADSGDTDYQISKSLRFALPDAPYLKLSGTSGSGNTRIWTKSIWVKKGKDNSGSASHVWSHGTGTPQGSIEIKTDNTFHAWHHNGTSWVTSYVTNRVLRDHSAFYHFVVAVNTNLDTESERVKIYINGQRETSFSTSTAPAINANVDPNLAHWLGSSWVGGTHFDGLIADPIFIDGLQLSCAAFGEFDSAGNWNPKEFTLPAPNQGTTYSSGASNTGNVWSAHTNNETFQPAAVFDGSLTTGTGPYAASGGSGTQGTCTFPVGTQTGKHHFRHYGRLYADGKWEDQDGNIIYESFADDNSNKWYDLGWHSDVTSLKITAGSHGNTSDVYALEVDGVMLRDGFTDPETRSKINNGKKWSDGVTLPGSGVTGAAANLFDGSLSSWVQTSNSSDWIEIDLGSVAFSNSFELYGSSSYDQDYKFYHGGGTHNWSGHFGGNAWKDFASSLISPVTKVEYKDSGGSGTPSIAAIRVDGEILVDGEIDKSFHLKFNDTTDNYSIGLDSLGEDYSKDDVTTGGPMRKCTTASGAIADTGFRTDPYKNNIVLAIPGDAYEDVSHTIKGSGSAKTVNRSGHHELNDNQYKFYGMSKYDNGWGTCYAEHADIAVAEGDDFTLEFWAYVPTPVTTHMRLFNWGTEANESNGARCSLYTGTGATDGTINCYFLGTGIGNGTVDTSWQNAWTHWALTRKSGTVRWFMNGRPVGDAAVTVNGAVSADELYIGAQNGSSKTQQWTGDFKFYNGVCKYDKPFKPLNRNDFYPNNIDASEIDGTIASSKFANIKYTGNGGTQTVVTGSFQPDFVWIKNKNSQDDHKIYDVVNGVEKYLECNTDDALTDASNGVTAFTSTGFTTGDHSSQNGNGTEYLATCFKAGGTASSNTNGSITSSVSASDIFSIVKFTGTGANATVGHGLPVAPHMIWFKNMDSGGHSWGVYHKELTGPNGDATKKITLDQDNTKRSSNSSDFFNDTHPTSTVFSIGSDPNYNTSGANMLAYCWAPKKGAAAFGWYTGNGSTTAGPFNRTTFKPEMVIIRCISANEQWWRWSQAQENDSDNTNLNDVLTITGDGAVVNNDSADLDIYHDGWRPQHSGNSINGNSQDYIWAAWGDGKGVGPDLDSLFDSPTNYEDTDSNVHGNFATWNPIDSGLTLNQGNLKSDRSTGSWQSALATLMINSGKYYFEITPTERSGTNYMQVGIWNVGSSRQSEMSSSSSGYIYNAANGQKYNGSGVSYGASWDTNDCIGVAFDRDNGTLTFYKNNVSQGTAFTGLTSGNYTFGVSQYGTNTILANFGQRSFKYDPPANHKALCTQNLDDFSSGNSVNNPSKYFDVLAYSGTGSALTLRGLNFGPDLVWGKQRNTANNNVLQDQAGTGTTGYLKTDHNGEIGTAGGVPVSAFNSDGVTLGTNNRLNDGSGTHVLWAWDAGTSAATASTDGSITPSAQWVNATAGFSISKYTGTGANATIGHALGAKPHMIIVKRIIGNSADWKVYHQSLGNTKAGILDSHVGGSNINTSMWQDTDPTNTVVSLSSDANGNASSDTYAMFCWTEIPGYSKFGTYTGNGNADGPMINLGFKPRWFMLKETNTDLDSSNDWYILDSARSPNNEVVKSLKANEDSAEATDSNFVDFLSNGVKLRTSGGAANGSGDTYIYAAFAEHPQKTSKAH